MKRISSYLTLIGLLSIVFVSSSLAQDQGLPSYSGYLNDFAGIVTSSDQELVTKFAKELEAKTTAQVAIVTVQSTLPDTIEGYAVRLFKKWGIGQKAKDNGILFLIASKDHTLRIEVGYGLEATITDALSSQIIQQIVIPQFKQGRVSQGVLDGTKAIISLIAKANGVVVTGEEDSTYNSLNQDVSVIWVIVFVFILIFIFYTFSFRSPGVGWYGSYGGGGGGFGGGSSSGGFGGFGGGGSGGGGASGRW